MDSSEIKKTKKPNIIKEKIKENKTFFYGFPIFVVVTIFVSLLFFIIPSIQYYFTSKEETAIVDQNILNVNKSINNLRAVINEQNDIRESERKLTEYVPSQHKLGDIVNIIQTKADDFSLEKEIFTSTNSEDRTSIENLAQGDESGAVFQSISSGEIEFQPKSLDKGTKAILISIEANVKGKKESFLNFLKDMDKQKPIINLVYIEYTESEPQNNEEITVNAVLRFESYAININKEENAAVLPKKLKKDDQALVRNIGVESFIWDKRVLEEVE